MELAHKNVRRLNTIRCIAVLIVLISHYSNESNLFGGVLGRGAGQFGVMLFFILSAFLMAYIYFDLEPNTNNLVKFAFARIFRVMPLFFLVVFLSYFANLILPPNLGKVFFSIPTFQVLLEHLLLLWGVNVFWTIPPEMHFYFIFALLWFLRSKSMYLALLIPLVGICIYMAFPSQHLIGGDIFGLNYTLSILWVYPYFCIGFLFGIFFKKWRVPTAFQSNYFVLSVFMLPLFYPLIFLKIFGYENDLWFDPGIFIVVSSVFFALVFLVPNGNIFLENRVGDFVGKISYSAYLLHYPILLQLKNSGYAHGLFGGFLFLTLTIGVSMISFKFFESPIRLWAKARLKLIH